MVHNQNIKELSDILGTININGDYSSDEVSDSYNNVIRRVMPIFIHMSQVIIFVEKKA